MKKKQHHIHDKFVKASFSDPDRAISFFEQFLPVSVLNHVNIKSLKVLNESYIQEDLTEHFSDIVFEVQCANEPIDLVLLFEHKSTPDKNVMIQVGHYIYSHWIKCINEKKPIKLIIPIIYYQGTQKWKKPKLTEHFTYLNDDLIQYLPDFETIFISLNTLSDENIASIRNGMMAAAIMAQKKGANLVKLSDDLVKIFRLFPEKLPEGNFVEQLFVYTFFGY